MAESTPLDRHKMRVLCGRIVRGLRHVYGRKPNTLGFESVWFVADRKAWTEGQVREAINYLMAAGYVESPDNKRDALDNDPFEIYGLSAKGYQLCSGTIADDSIEVALPYDE